MNDMTNPQVSIVIVCMNNLKNLYPCLDSIKQHTTVSYETLVVTYLFSAENLQKLRADYPWITIIESNEIRGFSENNNLALRQAKGKYCFVLNDDTYFDTPVIDELVKTIEELPDDVAIVSPNILNPDGTVQCCGRPPMNWKTTILYAYHLWKEEDNKTFVNKSGVFQSYNILGAAFLIKTDIFKNEGWFDEYYFFTPEDIALSTSLNENGYKCYVNANVRLVHIGGMSGKAISKMYIATRPASRKGTIKFYSERSVVKNIILVTLLSINTILKIILYLVLSLVNSGKKNSYDNQTKGELAVLITMLMPITPKEIFIRYYRQITLNNFSKDKHER
jgi:GT2 family glycosyltransferase